MRNFISLSLFAVLFIGTFHLAAQTPPAGFGNLTVAGKVVSKEEVKSINPELAGAETILSELEAELKELRKDTLGMVPEAAVQRALELDAKIQSQKLLIDYLKTLHNKPNQICYVPPCEPIQGLAVTFVPKRNSDNTSKSDLPPMPLTPVSLNNSPEKVRIIVNNINRQLDSLDERRSERERELTAPIAEFPCGEEFKNNKGEAVMAVTLKVKIALLQNEVSYLEAITAGEDKIPFAMTLSVLLSSPQEDIKTMTDSNNSGKCAEEIYGIVRRVISDRILVLQKEIELLESVKKIYETGVSGQ
ncbi:hypothetical protein FACS189419_03290 [Planctomycetales bacterium]|nr:hypothetical protein FACS189419_03290 [Planctomycetales bacterium]